MQQSTRYRNANTSPRSLGNLGSGMTASGDVSIEYLRTMIDRRLGVLVPGAQMVPQRLHQAVRYSLLASGKRLRPLLTVLTSQHVGRADLIAIDPACAIEMVHAASLVMDDLPAMDNSDLRRGQPTAHRQFGEDLAILSGIGLLNRAFGIMSSAEGIAAETRIELVAALSEAIGSNGLVGGQVLDLRERSPALGLSGVQEINRRKTAALFVAAAEVGARIGGANPRQIEAARRFGAELGFALQISDDLIDDPAFAGKTGKDTGKDAGKPTVVSVLGKTAATKLYKSHLGEARASLAEMNPAQPRNNPLLKFIEANMVEFKE
jgi:geranylgeranyl diphosphate synthase, type II